MLRKWGTLVLLLLATPILALAQNTGKLAGVVTDASTDEPLPGANVIIVGTQLGTATDVNGNYFILGVPVGTHNVQASFVGYGPQTVENVEVNAGYTRELDFVLSPGAELDEIIVEYERPLIQKDAVGAPKIVTAEELVNLPVRGVTAVAAIQAGVVNKEGSGDLHVRGGREEEVVYYIDGVKVLGADAKNIPSAAIQETEMIIGNISARYGDAMSGIINVTTKSGAPSFFGSIEGITSESLDPYGHNLVAGSIGGPVVGEKLNFFVAGEFTDLNVANPSAIGQLQVTDDLLARLRENPQVISVNDESNVRQFVEIPGTIAPGARFPVDDDGNVIVENGVVTLSDGSSINIPEGASIRSLNPTEAAGVLSPTEFRREQELRGDNLQRISVDGNLTLNPIQSVRVRTGGRYMRTEFEDFNLERQLPFAPETRMQMDRNDWQIYGTWTHYLSNSTFYQLQVDFADRKGWNYDNRFSNAVEDAFFYGDIDHPANEVIARYRTLEFVEEERLDEEGETFTVSVPVYNRRYTDGTFPTNQTVGGLVVPPGGAGLSWYEKFYNRQLRFSGTATTQVGLHQIEFGGEFEKRTNRRFYHGSANTTTLARWFADGEAEGTDNPVANYGELPYEAFGGDQNVNYAYYGYNYLGTEQVNDQDLDAFMAGTNRNLAPYEPLYYGGYIQDKIEFRDIVLNLGLRVDVFDNNTITYRDPFARLPIVRAGSVGAPDIVSDDWAVYFSGDDVVGYRDLEGTFYDPNGQETQAGNVVLAGTVRPSNEGISTIFSDYDPKVTWMPRVGVSFPVTDQSLFFARYGVVAQRPSEANFEAFNRLTDSRGIRLANNALEPQKTIEYELGFRQRLGARAALTISGFVRQIKDLAQLRIITNAYPNDYTTFQNVDFGTVKGAEFAFDLRRTNNVALNANYTLSFANGTGSDAETTTTIVWVNETQPNFISPLVFDQRHRMNLSMDYRLGAGEGPTVAGTKLLENFGVNFLVTAGSGFPYTGMVEPFNITTSKAPVPEGGINENRMPWTSRVDLRVDRRFPIGIGSNASVFLWVRNLLDTDNVVDVWNATGLGDDDGFLATSGGQEFLTGTASPDTSRELYRHRNRLLGNYGIPRTIRLGVRFDF